MPAHERMMDVDADKAKRRINAIERIERREERIMT